MFWGEPAESLYPRFTTAPTFYTDKTQYNIERIAHMLRVKLMALLAHVNKSYAPFAFDYTW